MASDGNASEEEGWVNVSDEEGADMDMSNRMDDPEKQDDDKEMAQEDTKPTVPIELTKVFASLSTKTFQPIDMYGFGRFLRHKILPR